MQLHELLKKYREACFLTQAMFSEEISINSDIDDKFSIGVLNGVERGGSITDKRLFYYLNKTFLFIDYEKNEKIVSLSYDIAKYAVENNIEIDIIKVFSFISLYDINEYISKLVEGSNDLEINYKSVYILLSESVDIKSPQCYFKNIIMNDTAIFCFSLCSWYFLLSNELEDINIDKKDYNSEEFIRLAQLFGFSEFTKTSEKARGKIARTIYKKLNLVNNISELYKTINFEEYAKEIDNNNLLSYQNVFSKTLNSSDENPLNVFIFKSKDFDYMKIVANEDDILKWPPESYPTLVRIIFNANFHLQQIYSFCQGRIFSYSPNYIEYIYNKFITSKLFESNSSLQSEIDDYIKKLKKKAGSYYNELEDTTEVSCEDCQTMYSYVLQQNRLFDIYKHYYLANPKKELLKKELNNNL